MDLVLAWIPALVAPFVGRGLRYVTDGICRTELTGQTERRGERWLVEVIALVIACWAAIIAPGWIVVASCVFGWTLLTLAIIDLECFILPDVLTLPMLVAGLVVGWIDAPTEGIDHVLGAVIGFISFVAITVVYRRVRGREGMGLGDTKLFAAIGAWVSWENLPTVALIAACLGLAFVLVSCIADRSLLMTGRRIPFGPFLAIAGWLVWLYGPFVIA